MLGFDRLASTLAEEILTPGEGQVRAMFVSGSNPAVCLPDQKKAVEALRDLELLVVMDPYLSATAKLAHYVLPPTMMYERSDLPIAVPGFNIGTISWSQYTPPVIGVPAGSDLVEDWYPYWAVAKRLGLKMQFTGTADIRGIMLISARCLSVAISRLVLAPAAVSSSGSPPQQCAIETTPRRTALSGCAVVSILPCSDATSTRSPATRPSASRSPGCM
jgi:hypothetical protein